MQLHRAIRNRMFPHLLVMFLWISLVVILALNLNFSVVVTEAVADGGYKVIMLFHLWMLCVPVVLCLVFYKLGHGEIVERFTLGLSMITVLFSIVNVALYFVNDLVLLMKVTELVAWTLYNCVFSISIYKISVVFLLPVLRIFERTWKEVPRNNKKLWDQGQKCERHHLY